MAKVPSRVGEKRSITVRLVYLLESTRDLPPQNQIACPFGIRMRLSAICLPSPCEDRLVEEKELNRSTDTLTSAAIALDIFCNTLLMTLSLADLLRPHSSATFSIYSFLSIS